MELKNYILFIGVIINKMTENKVLNYTISEKNYDKKIYSYLKKFANAMKSGINEFYNLNGEVITKERWVTHYLYNDTEVNACLDRSNNMVVLLQSCKDKTLINKLEKLAIKK